MNASQLPAEGGADGAGVGAPVGDGDGATDGASEGDGDGAADGAGEGAADGAGLGEAVGAGDGAAEGEAVGAGDGAGLGGGVKLSTSWRYRSQKLSSSSLAASAWARTANVATTTNQAVQANFIVEL